MINSVNLESIARIPFYYGHKGDKASQEMLLSRWEYESGAAGRFLNQGKNPNILILHNDTSLDLLKYTLASVQHQTLRAEKTVVYSSTSKVVSKIIDSTNIGVQDYPSDDLSTVLGGNDAQWTVIIEAGDVCNPSMMFSLIANSQHHDQVAYWSIIEANLSEGELNPIRHAKISFWDLLSENITPCSSFAVRGSARREAIRYIQDQVHPGIALWAKSKKKIDEYLSTKNIDINYSSPMPHINNTTRLALLESAYKTGFEMIDTRGLMVPLPKTKVRNMSIIVMYRDKPQVTRECIESIISSSGCMSLEILMIDNNSNHATKEKISQMVSDYSELADFKCLHYNKTFNHSAQLLLGLENVSNEIVALINNDVLIKDPCVLTHSAKWALCSNVASVGVLHLDEYGEKRGGPFKRRDSVINIVNSLVEEYSEIPARPFKSFGNTFAFMVARKSIIQSVSVDPFRFPNGYNDVDYCLRSHKSGFEHITLGYLTLIHLKGASRGRTDESLQKMLLRSHFSNFYMEPSELTEYRNISHGPIQF